MGLGLRLGDGEVFCSVGGTHDAAKPHLRHRKSGRASHHRADTVGMPIINTPSHRLSLDNIARAARLVDPIFLNNPQFECEPLSAALGATALLLKVETHNPLRSFKGRGVDFFMLENAERLAGRTLVCATAGNWGQAMAYVCRAR